MDWVAAFLRIGWQTFVEYAGGHSQAPETGPSRVDVMTEPYHSETDSMVLLGGSEFPEPKLKTVMPPHLKRSPASLNNIDLDDLCESQHLYELYEDAVERGWMPRGEAHMLFVFSAADHARHFRAGNPCGLFREIVQNNQRRLITDQEEDRARIRLREYLDQKRGSRRQSQR